MYAAVESPVIQNFIRAIELKTGWTSSERSAAARDHEANQAVHQRVGTVGTAAAGDAVPKASRATAGSFAQVLAAQRFFLARQATGPASRRCLLSVRIGNG